MTIILSCHDRVPLERAIEIIEDADLTPGDFVSLSGLHEKIERTPPSLRDCKELHWWLDHTLSLLVNRGYLRRLHLGPGELAYTPTTAWHDRDLVLKDLRPPKAKIRWARINARGAQSAERKSERAAARARRQAIAKLARKRKTHA
jgi:hypothetical protein